MSKRAVTRYPIHDLLAERWSPRAFDDRPVSAELLGSLFEAARWAPSCFNDQPWSFVVAMREDAEAHARMASLLVDANRVWAEKAPVLGVSIAHHVFARNGKPNRHGEYDTGCAAGMLVIQAQALGLVVHQMGGFDVEGAREAFDVPADHEPMAAFAIGYRADASRLPPELAERERAARERKPLPRVVFAGRFGEPHPAIAAE